MGKKTLFSNKLEALNFKCLKWISFTFRYRFLYFKLPANGFCSTSGSGYRFRSARIQLPLNFHKSQRHETIIIIQFKFNSYIEVYYTTFGWKTVIKLYLLSLPIFEWMEIVDVESWNWITMCCRQLYIYHIHRLVLFTSAALLLASL